MRAGFETLVVLAGALSLVLAGPAAAQEACTDRLAEIEAALAGADLPAGQREDVDKVLAGARDLAAAGEEDSCLRTADTLDQLRSSLALTGDAEAGQPEPAARSAEQAAPRGGAATPPPAAGEVPGREASPSPGDRAGRSEPAAALTAAEAEQLIGRRVVDRSGNPVGELVDVARLRGRDQAFAVLRYGGLLGFGERDAMVMLGELEHGEAGEVVLSRTAAGVLDELPEYDRATFESLTGRLD
jgi:hypothetical protein